MNVKKIAAAFAAAAMLGTSLTLAPAAIESNSTDNPEITADTSNMAGVINPAEYENLSENEKAYYDNVTVSGYVYFLPESDSETGGIPFESGTYYVRNDQFIYIAAFTESYVGHDIIVNGEKLDMFESGDGGNFGFAYYLTPDTKELNISMKKRELTAEEKANFVKISLGVGIGMSKNTNPDHPGYDEYGDWMLRIDDGDHARKGDWYYIYALTKDYIGNDIYLNGEKLTVYESGDGSNYGAYYKVKDTDTELSVTLVRRQTDNSSDPGNGDSNPGSNNYHGNGNTGSDSSNPGNNNTQAPPTSVIPNDISGSTAPGIAPLGGTSTESSIPTAAKTISTIKKSGKKDITVKASDEGITAEILSAFISNKKSEKLTVKYSSSLKIEISKKDINGKLNDLDFSKGGNFLSSKKISNMEQLKNAEKTVQLNFTNDGDFGGTDKVTVKTYIGSKITGKRADIYEYKDGKLVKISSCKITAAGYASFDINHYGKYVVALL